jgi:spore germination protein KA
MQKLLKSIGDLLIYKEPKNTEQGFEFLESTNEGQQKQGTETVSSQKNSTSGVDREKKGNKAPMKVKEWNQNRKNQQQNQNANQTYSSVNNQNLQDNNSQQNGNNTANQDTGKQQKNSEISNDLNINLAVIQQKMGVPKNQDIVIREFKIGRKIKAFLVYVDGMIDRKTINLSILTQLMSKDISEEIDEDNPVDYLIENVLTVNSLKKEKYYESIIQQVLSGDSALFIDGCSICITIETKGYEKRGIEAPKTESVVIGAQEGFTENLRTNLSMLRRIIKNEKMVTEMVQVGKANRANCAVIYLEGIASPTVIDEVKKRINKIDSDYILGDGMIEQFIEDNPLMLFPQVITTERPDRTAAFIMEGQVIVIGDGMPFSMAVPVTFFRLFHTSEDSFTRWPFATFLRMLRLFGLFCATLLPGLYVSMIMFHPEMIPTELLASIAKAKEPVPFPTLVEVLIMESAFELIREGGIRVPNIIGQTLGIVGALILGEAAVAAGLVSPILVIIVSVTALGSFAIPNYNMSLAVRIERFFFILAGALMGFYGISLVIFIMACFACSMKSFGVPFFSPVAPRTTINRDVVIKTPIWMQKDRPDEFQPIDRKKQGRNVTSWKDAENNTETGEKE